MKLLIKIIIALIISFVLGMIIGFYMGANMVIHEGIKIAKGFVNISVDDKLIEQAIWQYKNNIGTCFPPKF